MTERTFTTKVLRKLRTVKNLWVYKSCDKFTAGIPDLIFCYKGMFGAVELKTKKGIVSKIQKHTIKKIKEAGGIAFVLREGENLERITRRIDAARSRKVSQNS